MQELRSALLDDRSRFRPPWLFWESETYGLGKALRRVLHWPRALPIPATADHGPLDLALTIWFNEVGRGVPHLTWSEQKASDLEGIFGVKAIAMASPFSHWWNRRPAKTSAGPITIFPMHSTTSGSASNLTPTQYLEVVHSRFGSRPVRVCLHHLDFAGSGWHSWLSAGVDVVTAGNPLSPNFAQRLKTIIESAGLVVCPARSSPIAWSMLLGVPCALIGSAKWEWNAETPEHQIRPLHEPNRSFELEVEKDLRAGRYLDPREAQPLVHALFGVNIPTQPHEVRKELWRGFLDLPKSLLHQKAQAS